MDELGFGKVLVPVVVPVFYAIIFKPDAAPACA
jgi:hypothetical protein